MPRKPRTERETDRVRKNILEQALALIQEEGFEGFSMRKLSGRLGVSVVTLYRFYESRDHLYLAVLGRGFDLLFQDIRKAYDAKKTPEARLRAMARAYLNFGIRQANFYNLMFTWHVPKYQDYVGTPMEAAARHELDESQKVYRFTIEAVKELAGTIRPVTEEQIRGYIIFFWSALHGYVAGINNKLLTYMHEDPISLQDGIVDHLFVYLRRIIEDEKEKG
ncbi:MAG: TetR/AcrR family transcriptional regulator [Thermodesulfobacteriota bacterium]